MLTIRSPVCTVFLALLSVFVADVSAVPQNRKGGRKGSGQTLTLQQQAAQIPQGISQATDGSTILDTNATVKYDIQPPPPTHTGRILQVIYCFAPLQLN